LRSAVSQHGWRSRPASALVAFRTAGASWHGRPHRCACFGSDTPEDHVQPLVRALVEQREKTSDDACCCRPLAAAVIRRRWACHRRTQTPRSLVLQHQQPCQLGDVINALDRVHRFHDRLHLLLRHQATGDAPKLRHDFVV